MARDQVFISYSHADSEYLLRLKTHLRPFEREGKISIWADTKIKTGQLWKREIQNALDRSAVAILLISADFLASEFIVENELPPLLSACEQEGVKILPVIIKPCAFQETDSVSKFQSVNPPSKSVLAMSEYEKEQLWYDISKVATESLNEFSKSNKNESVAEAVQIIDDIPMQYSEVFASYELQWIQYYLQGDLDSPQNVDKYYVYTYEHVDILEFMPKAEVFLKPIKGSENLIGRVKKKFIAEGWEGDGTLRLLWLPPFIGAGSEDTWGVLTWFVKQDNNGTSFICFPVPLPFSRLLEQN